jgi:hypothetical protein
MTPDDLAHLRKRYLELNDTAAAISEEQAEIKRRIRDAHQPGFAETVGDGKVAVQPNRRFDPDKGAAMLPSDDLRALCRIEVYDAKAVKRLLPPAIQELCMIDVGEPRVVIQ